MPPIDDVTQGIFKVGHEVGELACSRYPRGVLVEWDHLHFKEAVAETRKILRDKSIPAIFEAAFQIGGIQCRADIIERTLKDAWRVIEVKSTTQCNDVHVRDLAFQVFILRKFGLKIAEAGVLTLNPDYRLGREGLDVGELFVLHPRLAECNEFVPTIERNVRMQKRMLGSLKAPDIETGDHCHEPYECPYLSHCTRDIPQPEHPIVELPNLRKHVASNLLDQGIQDIRELEDSIQLTSIQEIIREAVTSDREIVHGDLARTLKRFRRPIRHLDFETFAPAIPRFIGTRPYETIPFMFSVHTETAGSSPDHFGYLHENSDDPRLAVAEQLIHSLGKRGSICVYSPFERTQIVALMKLFPNLAGDLGAIVNRLVDLLPIVRNHYYHPDFHGSFSLKSVLPVLEGLSYDDLAITNGREASFQYMSALKTTNPRLRQRIFNELHKYCERDTFATLKVRAALEGLAR